MNEKITYQLYILISDYADTPDSRVDVTRQYSLSPVFDDLASCEHYAMGRCSAPMTSTSEDTPGIRYKRLIEYDIIDSEGNRLYITFA